MTIDGRAQNVWNHSSFISDVCEPHMNWKKKQKFGTFKSWQKRWKLIPWTKQLIFIVRGIRLGTCTVAKLLSKEANGKWISYEISLHFGEETRITTQAWGLPAAGNLIVAVTNQSGIARPAIPFAPPQSRRRTDSPVTLPARCCQVPCLWQFSARFPQKRNAEHVLLQEILLLMSCETFSMGAVIFHAFKLCMICHQRKAYKRIWGVACKEMWGLNWASVNLLRFIRHSPQRANTLKTYSVNGHEGFAVRILVAVSTDLAAICEATLLHKPPRSALCSWPDRPNSLQLTYSCRLDFSCGRNTIAFICCRSP